MQGFLHDMGISVEHREKNTGWPLGRSTLLFPIAQRGDRNPDPRREHGLREARALPNGGNIDVVRDMHDQTGDIAALCMVSGFGETSHHPIKQPCHVHPRYFDLSLISAV